MTAAKLKCRFCGCSEYAGEAGVGAPAPQAVPRPSLGVCPVRVSTFVRAGGRSGASNRIAVSAVAGSDSSAGVRLRIIFRTPFRAC